MDRAIGNPEISISGARREDLAPGRSHPCLDNYPNLLILFIFHIMRKNLLLFVLRSAVHLQLGLGKL